MDPKPASRMPFGAFLVRPSTLLAGSTVLSRCTGHLIFPLIFPQSPADLPFPRPGPPPLDANIAKVSSPSLVRCFGGLPTTAELAVGRRPYGSLMAAACAEACCFVLFGCFLVH